MRTEADIQAANKTLDDVLAGDGKWAITWLRCAFHTHKSQIDKLLDDIRELRVMYLQHVSTPLSVREAQLLHVCRICRQPESAPFVFNFGKEFAHTKCLESGGA